MMVEKEAGSMAEAFSLGGMLLGASSAATQVEGGDRNNNWYDWYRRGNIRDGSDPSVATMHWERWREDAQLMADMGLQCCRLGLEWSRIEPERGVFDESAVQHYAEELKYLSERGIKPMVTLWHFSNPLWFERSGGFLARGAKLAFLEYVEYIVPRLAPWVDCWITLNEPNVYAVNGYMNGDWPPGRRSIPAALRVMAALTPCHIEAYELIHRLVPDARVSFANHLRVFAPEDAKNPAHRAAARRACSSPGAAQISRRLQVRPPRADDSAPISRSRTRVCLRPCGSTCPSTQPGESPCREARSCAKSSSSGGSRGRSSSGQANVLQFTPGGSSAASSTDSTTPARKAPLPSGTATRRPGCQKAAGKTDGSA